MKKEKGLVSQYNLVLYPDKSILIYCLLIRKGKEVSLGLAMCAPDDQFDLIKGGNMARERADLALSKNRNRLPIKPRVRFGPGMIRIDFKHLAFRGAWETYGYKAIRYQEEKAEPIDHILNRIMGI